MTQDDKNLLARLDERVKNLTNELEKFNTYIQNTCSIQQKKLENKIYLRVFTFSLVYIPSLTISILKVAKLLNII